MHQPDTALILNRSDVGQLGTGMLVDLCIVSSDRLKDKVAELPLVRHS